MQRMMRAGMGTTTSTTARASAIRPPRSRCAVFGLSGATGTSPTSTSPTLRSSSAPTPPGPSGRGRPHQAGGAARHQADHHRSPPDRVGRLRSAAPVAATRHQRGRRARHDARDQPGRAGRPELHRRAHRGLRRAEELCEQYRPEAVEEITGVPAADIEEAAQMYAGAETGSFIWGLGYKHRYGSEVVQ